MVTVIVTNIAAKKQTLSNDIFAASGSAQTYNCVLKRLDFQQEQGFMSSLALGVNQIEIERGLTTSSTAIFVPFTTCELFQEGEALYYGRSVPPKTFPPRRSLSSAAKSRPASA